ncbi:MATH and LRR domain-containing protein PFE0570w isoform X2 [Planococcus citri]|uniref:MATH and LRR domain-containing protein PFE0570w isoform X2 n=1 Tax=Planococcus citri TaxID=170843 RepID=UPI0031F8E45F
MANELKTAEMLNSKVASDKQENVQSQNNPSNRDVNGVSDKNALTRVNDNKTVLDKKPTANGDIKPPSSLPELKKEKSALKTPTRKISPKSPEIGSANSLADKKIPMNKVQVGAAPSPNLKVVRSKIGSLENYTHKPGGGRVKIENRKLEWKVQPRIEAKNDKYVPTGGDKKITQVKLQWSAKSKIGSLENATHKPGGGDKKIESVKLDFKDKAKPKVGSKDNIKHVPGGGTVKKTTDVVDAKSTTSNIEDQKLDIKAQSKVGSLDNVKHRPGGGDKKIFDDKEYLKQTGLTNESSKANSVTTSGSQAPEDPQICSRDSQSQQKENQTAAPDAIICKKPDRKLDKDQVKPKNEPKSPKSDKKSQPSTPKQSLSAESKPTSSHPEKVTPAKSSTKVHEEKIDQKSKPNSTMPEVKPELTKIPSKDKIKTDFKSKVPTAQPKELVKIPSKENFKEEIKQIPAIQVKQNLDSVSKSDGKKLPDMSISRSENLNENKPKLSKDEIRNENNNKIEITAVDKKPSDVQVPKSASENKSISTTKPPVEVIVFKKQNSKSQIEPKLNISDTGKKEEKKESSIQDLKLDNVENKPNISYSKVKDDQVKPKDPIDSNKSSTGRSANIEDPKIDSINPNLKSSIENDTNKSKDQSKLSTNVPKENITDKNSNNKDESKLAKVNEQIETPKNSNLDQSKLSTNAPNPKESSDSNNENKSTKINEQIKTPNNLNPDQSKLPTNAPKENIENKLTKTNEQIKTSNNLSTDQSKLPTNAPKESNDSSNENKLTKTNEQSKTPNQPSSKLDDDKSKLPKPDTNQKDNVIQDLKPNSIKPPPEINTTSETFSPISKTAVETKPADSMSRTTAESKISNIPVQDEKPPLPNQTVHQSQILATNEKTEPSEKKNSESSSNSSTTSQNQQVPSIPSSTSGSK